MNISTTVTSTSSTTAQTSPNNSGLNGSMMLRRHSTNNQSNLNDTEENNVNSNHATNGHSNSLLTSPSTHSISINQTGLSCSFTSTQTKSLIGNLNSSFNNTNSHNEGSNATSNSINRNKLMMALMKSSCPDYFDIPRSTRRKILRFLCDNGWIDVS